MKKDDETIQWQGRYLDVLRRGDWEFVRRKNLTGIVGIIAVTDEHKLVLVEQYRPPLDRRVIELPAGIAGDIPGEESEPMVHAARRELLEETGYRVGQMDPVAEGVTSAGLTDESIHLFYASKLTKVAPGGGDDNEEIVVHEVPLPDLHEWLVQQRRQGLAIDIKVYVALGLIEDKNSWTF